MEKGEMMKVLYVVVCLIGFLTVTHCTRSQFPSQRDSHLMNWGAKHRTITRKLRDPGIIKVRVNGETGLKLGPVQENIPTSDNSIKEPIEKKKNSTLEEAPVSKKPALQNIKDPDSPYALLNEYFLDKPFVRNPLDQLFPNRSELVIDGEVFNKYNDYDGLDESEIHLVDGSMIVLTGWDYNHNYTFEDPDEPIDNYEAPYRPPKLPPPGFFPDGLFPIDGPDASFGFPIGNDIQDHPGIGIPIGLHIPDTGIPIGFGPPGVGLYHHYNTPFNSYSPALNVDNQSVNLLPLYPGVLQYKITSPQPTPLNNDLEELISVPHNRLSDSNGRPPTFEKEYNKIIHNDRKVHPAHQQDTKPDSRFIAPNSPFKFPPSEKTRIVNRPISFTTQPPPPASNFNPYFSSVSIEKNDTNFQNIGNFAEPQSHTGGVAIENKYHSGAPQPKLNDGRNDPKITHFQRPLVGTRVPDSFGRNTGSRRPAQVFTEKPLRFYSTHSFTTSTTKPNPVNEEESYGDYFHLKSRSEGFPQGPAFLPSSTTPRIQASGSFPNVYESRETPLNQNPLLLGDFEFSSINTESILKDLGFFDFGRKLSRGASLGQPTGPTAADRRNTIPPTEAPTLFQDDLVNYRDPLPKVNPNSEIVEFPPSSFHRPPSPNTKSYKGDPPVNHNVHRTTRPLRFRRLGQVKR